MTAVSYTAPHTLDEALRTLADLGAAATVVAGGQDVLPRMHQGLLRPSHLLDISRLRGLTAVEVAGDRGGRLHVGALVTHAALAREPVIRAAAPLLAEAAAQIGGGIQVRNRGTIGGAAAAANPAYDLPACLVALDAVVVLAGPRERRRVSAAAFFSGAGRTDCRADELVLGFEMPPMPPRTGWAYAKLKFTEGGSTVAGAACLLTLGPDGRCARASVVLSGVADRPVPLALAAERLAGEPVTPETLEAAAAAAPGAVEHPLEDVLAGGAYRRAMAHVMAAEALARAAGRARNGGGA
ncbi:MAG TPA: FAD binding domain-containing protein [bacterium]|nr:FAD binding domain-containing protein [bacterium]